jgi:sugar phosphate isomerase/epimerase
MIYLSGFADEAADGIDEQIRATRELGWSFIEARSVDGTNLHDLPDAAFDVVRRALDVAGVRVNCLGSTIANWGKSVDEDFDQVLAVTDRAIKRMKLLAVPLVRIMSYSLIMDANGRPCADQKKEERFRRLREICTRFLDSGITPVHENCFNYGGMSWEHSLELLAAVPGLKLVYDTGNPGLTPDFRKDFPYPNQDAWESYRRLREHVVHVHIKDGVRDVATGAEKYFFPDEGVCDVGRVVEDLLATGYDGGFTIEPHMALVYHDPKAKAGNRERFDNYVEYGRRVERMLARAAARAGRKLPATLRPTAGIAG